MRMLWKNHKGVTMIEVLVTVAILAIVVAPCLSAFVMAQRGNVKAAEVTNAYTAASNLMEELKGLPNGASVESRLDMQYPEGQEEKPNKSDGIYVIYEKVTDDEKGLTYYQIWVYAGEAENREKGVDPVSDGYILKGVIAP